MIKSMKLNCKPLFILIMLVSVPLFTADILAADKVKAPDFTLKSNKGENIRLSDLRGEIVLLNFWASWCGPCRQEMPILDKIHKKYTALGFKVLGVNVDLKSEKAAGYLKSTPVDFPVLYDPTGKVSELYNVSAMPSSAIIDRDGYIRYLHEGYKPGDEDKYHAKIKELMRE